MDEVYFIKKTVIALFLPEQFQGIIMSYDVIVREFWFESEYKQLDDASNRVLRMIDKTN